MKLKYFFGILLVVIFAVLVVFNLGRENHELFQTSITTSTVDPSSGSRTEPSPESEISLADPIPEKLNVLAADYLTLLPQEYDDKSIDSFVDYVVCLLEDGGFDLDLESIRSVKDPDHQFLSAIGVTTEYINSDFYHHPIDVVSYENTGETLSVQRYNGSPMVYKLVLDIPENQVLEIPGGEQTWYLITEINYYSESTFVRWFVSEKIYLTLMETQKNWEDYLAVSDFTVGSRFLGDFQNVYFETPENLPAKYRGSYLIITNRVNRSIFDIATQESMNQWSQETFGVTPYVKPPDANSPIYFNNDGGTYMLSEGGGPTSPSYDFFDVKADGDLTWYYYRLPDFEKTSNPSVTVFDDYSFMGYRGVKIGVRDGVVVSYLPLEDSENIFLIE